MALTVNGEAREVAVDPDTPLLWVLRDDLSMTGTKFGCGIGACGACSVLIDGVSMRSCQTPVGSVGSATITTIEGLSGPAAEAVRTAWRELDVVQCGYCQSGQIVSAVSLLSQTPRPTDDDIDAAMDGNVCRCGTYMRIRAAIHRAADILEG